jgi:hypothetical protein
VRNREDIQGGKSYRLRDKTQKERQRENPNPYPNASFFCMKISDEGRRVGGTYARSKEGRLVLRSNDSFWCQKDDSEKQKPGWERKGEKEGYI